MNLSSDIEFLEAALEANPFDDENFDMSEFVEKVYEIEDRLNYYAPFPGEEEQLVAKLYRLVARVKDEFDFYDEDAERAMMFPDGEDE